MKYEKKEIVSILEEIASELRSDPNLRELSEEYQRRYGMLTEEDLKKVFTI